MSTTTTTFRPYRKATRETPLLNLCLEPCAESLQPLVRCLYRLRWWCSHPLRTNLVPKALPYSVTVGEVVLLLPLVVLLLQSYHYTFTSPNVDDSGAFASYSLFLVYITANKSNSLLTFVFGIPFERLIALHNLCSVFCLTAALLHGWSAFEYDTSEYARYQPDAHFWNFLLDGMVNISGSVVVICMTLLIGSSFFGVVRRVLFQTWLYLHVILAVSVLVGLFLHGVNTAIFVAIWWGVDLLVRYVLMAGCTLRTTAHLRKIADETQPHEPAVELSFSKPTNFDYNAGQFVQICVPKINFEFHPISISSAPHEQKVTLHVRKLGNWTQRLVQLAEEQGEVTILMEGPYGSLSVDVDNDGRYKTMLFVSGGIGVTPCQSIAKSVLYQSTVGRQLEHVQFVWAVRSLDMVRDIPPLYTCTDDCSDRNESRTATVDIYSTRHKPDDDEEERGATPHYNLHNGRPNLDEIFATLKRKALDNGEYSVAVFGCGPAALMRDLSVACRKHSPAVVGCSDGVFFDLHTETFEF